MLPNPVSYFIYTGQPLSLNPAHLYAYILASQGVIKLAETQHFTAAMPLSYLGLGAIAGLPEYPGWLELHVPRIPVKWLRSVLADARQRGRTEQMYHFHYIAPEQVGWPGQWRVSLPKQKTGAAYVAYRGGSEASIVLDLHSHHEMQPFFSETDNADEQGCRFYAVIGHIHSRPELRLRLGIYGDWWELPPTLLFEDLGPFERARDR